MSGPPFKRCIPIPLPTDGAVVEIILPRAKLTAEEFDWLHKMVGDLRRAFVECAPEREEIGGSR